MPNPTVVSSTETGKSVKMPAPSPKEAADIARFESIGRHPTPFGTQDKPQNRNLSAEEIEGGDPDATNKPVPTENPSALASEAKGGTDKDSSKDSSAEKPASEEKPTEDLSFDIPVEKEVDPQPTVQARDYSKFPEEIRPLVNKLPNATFNKFAPEITKWYEAAKKVPDLEKQLAEAQKSGSFINHPEAYKLAPEFNQLQQQLQYDEFEKNHWYNQLLKIRSGEDWVMLTGYDQQGLPLYQQMKAPDNGQTDIRAELQVNQFMNEAQMLRGRRMEQLRNLQENFAGSFQQAQEQLAAHENKLFPGFVDESKLSEADKKYMQTVSNGLPPALKTLPVVSRYLQKSFASFMRLLDLYRKVAAENDRLKGTVQNKTLVGLNASELNTTTNGKAERMYSAADFED